MYVCMCVCIVDRVEDDSRSAGQYETLSGPAAEIPFRNGKTTKQGNKPICICIWVLIYIFSMCICI